MKYSLGISSKKIASIVFLLITLVIALLLSGIPMFVSTHPATMPLLQKEGFRSQIQPMSVVVEEKSVGEQSIQIAPQPKSVQDNSKEFDHLIGLNPSGERFHVIRNF